MANFVRVVIRLSHVQVLVDDVQNGGEIFNAVFVHQQEIVKL